MPFKQFLPTSFQQWLYPFIILASGLLSYSAILLIGSPSQINQLLSAEGSTLACLVLIIPLYCAYRVSSWLGAFLSFNATLILFGLKLSSYWRMGRSDWTVIGGLLPLSDASHYYQGATRLLEGDTLSVIASWRPLPNGMLGVLLGITQQNLQITLAILVLINAIACFLLAREVQGTHGTIAGVVTLIIIFWFYSDYLGTVMTENLGVAWGTIGLALVWRGAAQQQMKFCLLAIFLLTIGLIARAGPFFILPALVVWGSWTFRRSSVISYSFALGGFSLIFLGFILNSLVFKAIASPETVANSNFAYVFYGLITNQRWTKIFEDYPLLNELQSVQRTAVVYQLAWQAFVNHPFRLVLGILRTWKIFIFDDFIFSFIEIKKIDVIFQLSCLIALFNAYRQRQQPTQTLLLALVIGILLSVPFVPPWDAGVRPYAAIVPVFALLAAVGVAFIAQKLQLNESRRFPEYSLLARYSSLLGLTLVISSVFGSFALKIVADSPQLPSMSCPSTTERVYFRYTDGSSLKLVADNATKRSYVPKLRLSDYRTQLKPRTTVANKAPAEIAKELLRLPPNTTIINTINLEKASPLWIVADSELIPDKKGIVAACVKPTDNPYAQGTTGVSLYYAQSMQWLSP